MAAVLDETERRHGAHRIERIVPEGVVTVDGTAARGRHHLLRDRFPAQRFPGQHGDHRTRRSVAARAVGRLRRRRTSASPCRTSPTCSACTARGPTSPPERACSTTPNSRATTRSTRSIASSRPTRGPSRSAPDAHDEYADRYQKEISSLVWAHPSIAHSHYKNAQGKVYTLSPWPLDHVLGLDPHRRPRRLRHFLSGVSSCEPGAELGERAEQSQLLGAAAAWLGVEDHQDLTF